MDIIEFWLDIISIGIVLLIGLVGVSIQIWLAKKENSRRIKEEKSRQQQILKSLEGLRIEWSIAMKGHIKELNRKPPRIPSYFIPKFNSFYYLSNLSSKISLFSIEQDTFVFKQILIKLENEINTINRLVELAQNAEVLGNNKVRDILINELKQNTYYQDLDKSLKILGDEWYKLEGYM